MKKNLFCLTMLLLTTMATVIAQTVMLEKKVTIQYFDVKLEDALDDISASYDVNFSYSKNVIPVSQRVSADANNTTLAIALEDLFDETNVDYVGIGDQIVLKVDPKKRKLLSKGKPEKKKIPAPMPKRKKLEQPELLSSTDIRALDVSRKPITLKPVAIKYPAPVKSTEQELTGFERLKQDIINISEDVDEFAEMVVEEVEDQAKEVATEIQTMETKPVRINLFGRTNTRKGSTKNRTNHLSANILWGKNGGVEGVEVGGIVNSIVNDVKGVQVAGIGNVVGGNVTGTQASGIFNVNRGKTQGIQATGILNATGQLKNGVQAAGLINVAGRESKNGMQVSGLLNVNRGSVLTQIAVINKARKAKLQIGLINFADSSKATIGLLNFVRRGYNRFEISGEDVLYFNTELKLGSDGFYNIFRLGWHPLNSNEGHLGYGYGIGTRFKGKRRFSQNLELIATQINKKTSNAFDFGGEQKLNLLTQLRWTWDVRVGRRTSLFLGPTFNAIFSRVENPDTGEMGYGLAQYDFYNKTFTNTKTTITPPTTVGGTPTTTTEEIKTNIQGWVGVKAGIRF